MKRVFVLFMVVIAIVSCETDADITLHTSDTFVMSSFIYQDSDVVVNVYKSVSYSDSDLYKPVDWAVVRLYVNDVETCEGKLANGDVSLNLGHIDLATDDVIKIVSSNGSQKVSAETVMLAPVVIESVDTSVVCGADTAVEFSLTMTDPSHTDDYYQIVCRRHEKKMDGTEIITTLDCDYSDYIFYIANSTILGLQSIASAGLFTDETIVGRRRTITFSVKKSDIYTGIDDGSSVSVEVMLYHHREEYYYYMRTSLVAQNYILLPVFGMSSVYTNVDGGVGLVSGMSLDRVEIDFE